MAASADLINQPHGTRPGRVRLPNRMDLDQDMELSYMGLCVIVVCSIK